MNDSKIIGIDIHMDFRQKGYAKQAFKEYLKDKEYAKLWVFDNNFAKNIYINLGFIKTGAFKYIKEKLYIEMEYIKN
jgi:predicted GNAT family acetyltransferase